MKRVESRKYNIYRKQREKYTRGWNEREISINLAGTVAKKKLMYIFLAPGFYKGYKLLASVHQAKKPRENVEAV